jgi:hypothetical protein
MGLYLDIWDYITFASIIVLVFPGVALVLADRYRVLGNDAIVARQSRARSSTALGISVARKNRYRHMKLNIQIVTLALPILLASCASYGPYHPNTSTEPLN